MRLLTPPLALVGVWRSVPIVAGRSWCGNKINAEFESQKVYPRTSDRTSKTGGERPPKGVSKFDPFRTSGDESPKTVRISESGFVSAKPLTAEAASDNRPGSMSVIAILQQLSGLQRELGE